IRQSKLNLWGRATHATWSLILRSRDILKSRALEQAAQHTTVVSKYSGWDRRRTLTPCSFVPVRREWLCDNVGHAEETFAIESSLYLTDHLPCVHDVVAHQRSSSLTISCTECRQYTDMGINRAAGENVIRTLGNGLRRYHSPQQRQN